MLTALAHSIVRHRWFLIETADVKTATGGTR
jgi:hypothetical protein